MTLKNSLTFTKLTAVVFVSISVIFGVKYFDIQGKNKKLKENFVLDKKTYSNDLNEIFNRYDNEVLKNKKLSSIKVSSKPEVAKNESGLPKINEIIVFKPINNSNLVAKVDSLKNVVKIQSNENQSLSNQIAILITKNKELQKENTSNENIISVSKNLTATNVYANGIKILSNNIIETKRFSNTEQIKVCFTLLENKAAIKGNKDIYIQIVNPNNKVVNKNGESFKSGEKLLDFSAKTNVFYDNEELDVCVFVDPNKSDLYKGDYEINIFSGINLIGNTVFSLK